MTVTLKDVARAAKVSVSTASRALAGRGLASRSTQARLQRIAADLGYRPNTLARGLKTRSSRLVGLVMHNLANESFRVIAEVVQTRMRALGYQVILCITGDDPAQELDTLATLADHRVDGLVIVPTGRNGARLAALQASGVPVTCLIRRDAQAGCETVLAGDPDGAYEGARYLIGLGHRRIGLIAGRPDTTSGRERVAGYRRALQEAGLRADPALVHAGHFEPETGAAACRALLDLAEPPTALFVANHEAALGVFRTLAERADAVPDALSLLCYEDSPWFAWHRPSISVVDSGPAALAGLAVDRLLQRMGDAGHAAAAPREYRIGAQLVRRDSCRPPAQG